MNTTYPLTTAGVHAWQADYHQADSAAQAAERHKISLQFYQWLTLRFELDQEQVEFLYGLSPAFLQELQQEIINSLLAEVPIFFEREPRPAARNGGGPEDSVKVAALKKKREAEEEDVEEDDPDDSAHAGVTRGGQVSQTDDGPTGNHLYVHTFYRQP